MDILFNDLKHIGHLPRKFPSSLSVDSIGYLPQKTDWVRFRFDSFNFSFILSGGGEYKVNGHLYNVEAPCVLIQMPDILQEYGPSGKWTNWEELYLIYDKSKMANIEKMGLFRADKPVWSIQNTTPFRTRIKELQSLSNKSRENGVADRIDRLCELMIIESIIDESVKEYNAEEKAALNIQNYVTLHFREHHDFDLLAKQHALSYSTFRRYWLKQFGEPPAHYSLRLKIEEACRLLVETNMKASEIAHSCGFEDELYFFRRFKISLGLTAIEYRKRHQYPLQISAGI